VLLHSQWPTCLAARSETNASDERANETAAVSDMSGMHGSSAHMHMTEMAAADGRQTLSARIKIVTQLRAGIEKYRDYHVALNEGYKIFLLKSAAA